MNAKAKSFILPWAIEDEREEVAEVASSIYLPRQPEGT